MSRLFPELDGAAAVPSPPPQAATTPPKVEPARTEAPAPSAPVAGGQRGGFDAGRPSFAEQRTGESRSSPGQSEGDPQATESIQFGGMASREKYAAILGLPGIFMDETGSCAVLTVKLHSDGHVALDVEGGGVPRRTLWFWPKGRIPNPPLSGADFDIGIRGSTNEKIVGMFLAAVGRRLARVTLRSLTDIVTADNETRDVPVGAHGEPIKPKPVEPQPDAPLPSLIDHWGDSGAWYSFFADDVQRRNFCKNNFSGAVVKVSHEDLECAYATPSNGNGTTSFFNYPRSYDSESAPVVDGGALSQFGSPSALLATDLTDVDVIKGGANKLDRALHSLSSREDKPELVIVQATCVPVVIGDDMEGSVEKFRQASNLSVVFVNDKADIHSSPFRSTYRSVRGDLEFKHPVKRPGSINLLGLPRAEEMQVLIQCLEDLGITINCVMLPDFNLKVMRRYRAADLSVLSGARLYDYSYEEIFGEIDVPTIRPADPFGLAATRNWLFSVAEAMGRTERFEEVWQARLGAAERRFLELKAEASGYVLGFVVDSANVNLLLEPRSVGIPMLTMLDEMGFTLEFLVYVPHGDATQDPTVAKLQALGRHTSTFSDPASLSRELTASRAQAFYSEMFFDRRLTRCGKGQFSVSFAQVSIEGAVATMERILAVCKMPFYRRYAGFLGPAFPAVEQVAR